jgi:hypothetical protein
VIFSLNWLRQWARRVSDPLAEHYKELEEEPKMAKKPTTMAKMSNKQMAASPAHSLKKGTAKTGPAAMKKTYGAKK